MSIQRALAIELEREVQNTQRFLSILPDDQFDYKPHPKSMSLGALANHIVELHGWLALVLKTDDLNFHTDYTPLKLDSKASLLAELNKNKEEGDAELAKLTEENYFTEWALRAGEHIIVKLPKAGAIRFLVQNHLIHHRGQLSVYLRLLDVPIPGVYGPSADEQ